MKHVRIGIVLERKPVARFDELWSRFFNRDICRPSLVRLGEILLVRCVFPAGGNDRTLHGLTVEKHLNGELVSHANRRGVLLGDDFKTLAHRLDVLRA